jgi:hypothetical protein
LTESLPLLRCIDSRQPDPSLFTPNKHGNRIPIHDGNNPSSKILGDSNTGERSREKASAK